MSELTDKYLEYLYKRKDQVVTIEDLRSFAWEIKRTENRIVDLQAQINALTPVGSTIVLNQVPGGALNGVNTVYTTADSFVTGTLMVYYNGSLQRLGTDYTETGAAQFTMGFPPDAIDNLIVAYKH